MNLSRLGRGELLAVLGGLLLALGVFLPWYGTNPDNRNANLDGARGTFSRWEAHPILRWLLLAAALAPLILAWIIVRDHQLSWPRGEMTAVVGMIALVLVLYVGLVDRPGRPVRADLAEVRLVRRAAGHRGDHRRRSDARERHRTTTKAPRSPMTAPRDDMPPDRNLALELVRVTEAAALQAARYVGMGDKEAADQAAVDGMHAVLHTIHMDGVVVIGEGEKDEAPMLANGEVVGDGTPPHVDIAVDPLDGTRLTAQGRPNAVAVIALSERGTMFDPGPVFYMEKMAAGDGLVDLLDFDRPLGKTVELIAERRGVEVRDVMVVVLDRPAPRGRHQGDPRRGCAGAADHRRRRRRRADGRRAGPLRGPAVGDRRHAGGRDHRRGAEVLRRRDDRPAAPAGRRGAREGRGRRGMTSTR